MMNADAKCGKVWSAIIGGRPVDTTSSETFLVREPTTAAVIARVQSCTAEIVANAVVDSRRAFDEDWRHRSPRERAELLRRVAARLRDHVDELAELEAREVGKPKRDALRLDVTFSHACFDYFAGLCDSLHGEILHQGVIEARVVYEPYGVVAAILPFNWPPMHFSKKCAPALAAGNTVVIKPGEQAPLSVMRMVEIANEVLPPGVLNCVTGLEAGVALTSHPMVERITFTGATSTGRRVLESAAKNVTYATMELGGKNCLLVLHDADLTVAVDVALEGMFYNNGEACTSTSRILVHDSVYEEFKRRFVAATEKLVVGDGLDPNTDIGPMVDARQMERVLGYIDIALKEGARIVMQGRIPQDPRYRDGYWVAPTILEGVTAGMTVAQEEIFGPVACLMRFTDEADAIRIANGTQFGLTAVMVTRDEARAWKIAQKLEAGMIFINNYMRRTMLGSPFGGVKGSGFGRENSPETLKEFVRAKNIRFPSGHGKIPTWPPVQ
ncbi:MAG: aldehyde dehydrogenase family protein [Alphaproteobacteria bacterium]|nr:aldehyde dehydrogenase family protein [Alphaproteobacteria bacterium]